MRNLFRKDVIANYIWGLVRAVLITGLCFIILYPFMIKIFGSFMEYQDLFDPAVNWIPRNFTLEQYEIAWEYMNYPRSLLNTFMLTIMVTFLQVISCTIIGYGFGRYEFTGKNLLFGLVIFTLVVPPQLIMIPIYLNFRFFDFFGIFGEGGINLIGSYWPFILTALTGMGLKNGLYIYIMRQFFKGMPDSLEESAYVDGAGSFRTFVQIMLPGAIPAIVIVFIFSFVWQWNDVFYLNLYIRNVSGYLSHELQNFSFRFLEESNYAYSFSYLSLLDNTGMILFMAPLIVMFAFMQRYFIESVERTGIVG
ncbi:MAG: carbohydrate ABC transporter permease [bacterium]